MKIQQECLIVIQINEKKSKLNTLETSTYKAQRSEQHIIDQTLTRVSHRLFN